MCSKTATGGCVCSTRRSTRRTRIASPPASPARPSCSSDSTRRPTDPLSHLEPHFQVGPGCSVAPDAVRPHGVRLHVLEPGSLARLLTLDGWVVLFHELGAPLLRALF